MAELKDVLGTVLRDVVHSRVTSDLFSRDVSLDYAKDPLLAAFPVPRLEIKEASIQLRFAVNKVEQTEADRSGITRAAAARHAGLIARGVVTEFVARHPRSSQIQAIIDSKRLDLEKALHGAAEAAAAADARLIEAALQGQPQGLVDRVNAEVSRVLLEDPDIKRELTRGATIGAVRAAVRAPVGVAVDAFVADLAIALEAAKRQATRVDIAVTRSELAQVAEPLVSHISVVVQIRNYEWSEVVGADGTPVQRLNPE